MIFPTLFSASFYLMFFSHAEEHLTHCKKIVFSSAKSFVHQKYITKTGGIQRKWSKDITLLVYYE